MPYIDFILWEDCKVLLSRMTRFSKTKVITVSDVRNVLFNFESNPIADFFHRIEYLHLFLSRIKFLTFRKYSCQNFGKLELKWTKQPKRNVTARGGLENKNIFYGPSNSLDLVVSFANGIEDPMI